MGRLSVSDLPPPDYLRQNVNLNTSELGFEAKSASKAEDQLRSRLLRSTASRYQDLIDVDRAADLARRLESPGWKAQGWSGASSRHMRRFRRRFISALWQLTRESPWSSESWSTFTAISRSWEFTPRNLHTVNPQLLLEGFRGQLRRAGCGLADGALIACIHGEFEPLRQVYQLHLHGLASGEMVEIIDRLRRLPSFKSGPVITSPIRISRQPLEAMPYPLGYVCKSYWPCRRIGPVGADNLIKRERNARRIPEPFHSQVLLWLDEWQIEDLTLLVNVRVGRNGFVLTPKNTTYSNGERT